VRLYSFNFDQRSFFDTGDIARSERERWSNYIRGVLWVLASEGYAPSGFDALVIGDVPLAAGLSSSAALEVAALELCDALYGLGLSQKQKALLGQRAENRFVGVQCGIMDQLISATGATGHAMLIDCRSLEGDPVPLPEGVSVVVVNSMVERGLVDSAYNERRQQCEEAARLLGAPALRDVTREAFARRADSLPPVVRKRAAHVIEENDRTLRAAAALRAGDLETVGVLFNESHASLRDLFEVTVPALDTLAALAQGQPGCYGSRMTGGGFGGCTVSLVTDDAAPAFVQNVAAGYQEATGMQPEVYVCRAAAGSGVRAL
jgi:galactokinase